LLDKAVFTRKPTTAELKSKVKLNELNVFKEVVRDALISLFALASTSYFIYYCFNLLNNPSASADDKKWAMSIITLITSGVIGYLVGKVAS
jgi:hypothetical protein